MTAGPLPPAPPPAPPPPSGPRRPRYGRGLLITLVIAAVVFALTAVGSASSGVGTAVENGLSAALGVLFLAGVFVGLPALIVGRQRLGESDDEWRRRFRRGVLIAVLIPIALFIIGFGICVAVLTNVSN